MRTKFWGLVIAAVVLLTGATNWDGVATVDPAGDLPGGGHSIATNAFPKNTVLDVTNLENFRTTRVIVTSGLNDSGLLATLSRSVAETLGISGNSVFRIRMVQPPDEIAYSYLRQLGYVAAAEGTNPTATEPLPVDLAVETEPESAVALTPPEETIAEAEPEYAPVELSLVPSSEWIPESADHAIADEHLISPIEVTVYWEKDGDFELEEDYNIVVEVFIEDDPDANDDSPFYIYYSPFQAPLISRLESNMWYVQVAAYTRPDFVEEEISRIGSEYPLAIQNVGTDTSPLFRVLLGPLNQGESAATLRRVKSIGYKNAFARRG